MSTHDTAQSVSRRAARQRGILLMILLGLSILALTGSGFTRWQLLGPDNPGVWLTIGTSSVFAALLLLGGLTSLSRIVLTNIFSIAWIVHLTSMELIGGAAIGPFIVMGPLMAMLLFIIHPQRSAVVCVLLLLAAESFVIFMKVGGNFVRDYSVLIPDQIQIVLACSAFALSLVGAAIGLYYRRLARHLLQTIERLAAMDHLTQLYNRRALEERLARELSRGRRDDHIVAFLMIDIDRFKQVNDRFGHAAGDHCLQKVATLLRELVSRGSDTVARYGGEEFAVVLAATDLEGACQVGERMREAIAQADFSDIHPELKLSVSVGVSAVQPKQPFSAEQLIDAADRCLYRAKDSGRDRTVCEWAHDVFAATSPG